MSYALKLGGVAIAILVIGFVAILIFDAIWFRVGFGAAFLLLAGILLFIAWRSDKKAKEERAGLERI
jgi:hypothetical protein